eukprot:TRINITY_DN4163_c0_g1_i4.p1 TRINITY_DN4163_c0_g1~~TRINITY_DN4163_c0_g1_i4.p1  ORF type:complete len:110 (-),score=31.77 TRINITY_DN4163_c0_g1_i4:48-377(-)
MRLVFNLFDLDADERLSKKEFKKISTAFFQTCHADQGKRYAPLLDLFAQSVFSQYDRKEEGYLSFSDWRRFAEEDELILSLIHTMSPPRSDFPSLSFMPEIRSSPLVFS